MNPKKEIARILADPKVRGTVIEKERGFLHISTTMGLRTMLYTGTIIVGDKVDISNGVVSKAGNRPADSAKIFFV
ncbi:MAG: hypothetical protein GY835_11350 [bacterium]|nr:hypothetical protein [bacterium]